jgi:hypothetical protein
VIVAVRFSVRRGFGFYIAPVVNVTLLFFQVEPDPVVKARYLAVFYFTHKDVFKATTVKRAPMRTSIKFEPNPNEKLCNTYLYVSARNRASSIASLNSATYLFKSSHVGGHVLRLVSMAVRVTELHRLGRHDGVQE